jgi:hypothetical protein
LGSQLNGRTVTFSVRVKTSTANACRLAVQSNPIPPGPWNSSYHSGNGQYQTLSVTATLPTGLTGIGFNIAILFEAGGTYYVDNAMLVVGAVPSDYVPLHPADDLARCLRYYERSFANDGAEIFTGTPGAGATYYNRIIYRAAKPVTPTATIGPTWSVLNSGQPTASSVSGSGIQLSATAIAAGYAWVMANISTGYWIVEANP